jgi:WD40 repeat protein
MVRLWDVTSRQPLGDPLTSHAGPVLSVAFSPDSALLASVGFDRTVRLWDVTSRQPLGEPLTGHTGSVGSVAFSPDGALLATTSDDQTIRLWALPRTWIDQACELVGRNLSQAEWDEYIRAGRPYVRQCEQFPQVLVLPWTRP